MLDSGNEAESKLNTHNLKMKTGRPRILTDEQREENKTLLSSTVISIRIDRNLLSKIDKFAKQYKSRNLAIFDLIKTNSDFQKMFPKTPIIKIK